MNNEVKLIGVKKKLSLANLLQGHVWVGRHLLPVAVGTQNNQARHFSLTKKPLPEEFNFVYNLMYNF